MPYWIKCNIDGSANKNTSACRGIFRNSNADLMLCFAENTGCGNVFHVELSGAMRAIEIVDAHNWSNLWLELDSSLVVNAFKNKSVIPWSLSNRWNNCFYHHSTMNFFVSHIFREGNQCANGLVNFGLSLSHLTCWNQVPPFIQKFYVENKIGWPMFRFTPSLGGFGLVPLLFILFCCRFLFVFINISLVVVALAAPLLG